MPSRAMPPLCSELATLLPEAPAALEELQVWAQSDLVCPKLASVCQVPLVHYFVIKQLCARQRLASSVDEFQSRQEVCGSCLQDLSLQHISNILWAYESFLQMQVPMTSAFLEELKLRLRKATLQCPAAL